MKDYKLSDLFSFDERDVSFKMLYDMKLADKFCDAFDFVFNKLPAHKVGPLEKMEWSEGKNYHWVAIQDSDISILIRRYRLHFTVYFRNNGKTYYRNRWGCFIVETVLDGMPDDMNDMYVDDNFIDINSLLKPLIKMIKDNMVAMIWNDHSLPRPKHVKMENVWNGGDDLSSFDRFAFCCDELFNKYLTLFAENEMLERIKQVKEGDMLGGVYRVEGVSTEVKDEYYHGAGLHFMNTNFERKKDWADVYSLTRFYMKEMFPGLDKPKQKEK